MMKVWIARGFMAALILGAANMPAQSAPGVVEFNVPNAQITEVAGINDSGYIVGQYSVQYASNGPSGFLRAPNGALTTFNPEGSMGTMSVAINSAGVVVGNYSTGYPAIDGLSPYSGFVRAADGAITTFSGPNSTQTAPTSINSSGTIAGYYFAATSSVYAPNCGFKYGFVPHGFVRSPTGTLTSFDPPGAVATFAVGINDNGLIAGRYCDSKGMSHGFLRNSGGRFVYFDPPGSAGYFGSGTNPTCINFAGEVAGSYTAVGSNGYYFNHGFVRHSDGVIETFAPAGSVQTFPSAIDDAGAVTGSYLDSSSTDDGFERYTNGTFVSFDPPGVFDQSGSGSGTYTTGINDSGKIVGTYTSSFSTLSGFLRVR